MSSNSITNWSWTPHLTIAKTSADRRNGRKLKITKKDYEDLLTTTQVTISEEGNLNNNNQPLTTLTQSISTSIQTSVIALNNNNTSSKFKQLAN